MRGLLRNANDTVVRLTPQCAATMRRFTRGPAADSAGRGMRLVNCLTGKKSSRCSRRADYLLAADFPSRTPGSSQLPARSRTPSTTDHEPELPQHLSAPPVRACHACGAARDVGQPVAIDC